MAPWKAIGARLRSVALWIFGTYNCPVCDKWIALGRWRWLRISFNEHYTVGMHLKWEHLMPTASSFDARNEIRFGGCPICRLVFYDDDLHLHRHLHTHSEAEWALWSLGQKS